MTTNLITALLSVALQTNTFIVWPKQWRYAPCPDGVIGCLVNHGFMQDETSAKNRTEVTEIRSITTLTLPDFGKSIEVSNVIKSRIEVLQSMTVVWVNGETRTNGLPGMYFGGMLNVLPTNVISGATILLGPNARE